MKQAWHKVKIECKHTAAAQLPFTKRRRKNKRTNRLSLLVLLVWLGLRAWSDFIRLPLLVNRQRNLVNRRRRRRRRLLTRKTMSTHITTVNALKARSATQLRYLHGSHLFLHTALRARHALSKKNHGSCTFFKKWVRVNQNF